MGYAAEGVAPIGSGQVQASSPCACVEGLHAAACRGMSCICTGTLQPGACAPGIMFVLLHATMAPLAALCGLVPELVLRCTVVDLAIRQDLWSCAVSLAAPFQLTA